MRTLAILLITGATLAQAQTPPAVRPTAPASKAPMRHVGTRMDDSKLLLDAGAAALTAAKAKDVPAIVALSDQLYESCTSCHTHYRPGYGKKHEGPSTW